jgi:acyl carrier protein
MVEETEAPARARLLGLPRAERREALTGLVLEEFRRALLMSGDEEVPLDDNYFDLGLTSLKAAEVKQRLEAGLGCELDTSVLFASATVRQVVDHLADVALPPAADQVAKGDDARQAAGARRGLVEDMLRDLYEN